MARKQGQGDEEKGRREVEMVGIEEEVTTKEDTFDIRTMWGGGREDKTNGEGGEEEGPVWGRIKSFVTGEDPPQEEEGVINDMMNEIDNSFSLTYEQRLWGFGVCLCSASVCGVLSAVFLFLACLSCFATFYTLSNIGYLACTFFLKGPKAQFESMTQPDRLGATVVFVGAMICTLVAAFVLHMALLALIFVIIQSLALFWYSISYIPGARSFIENRLEGLMGD